MSGAFTQETTTLRREIEAARRAAERENRRAHFDEVLKLRILSACQRFGNKQVCEAIGLHPNMPYQWTSKGLTAPEEPPAEQEEETMPEETQEEYQEVDDTSLEASESPEGEATTEEPQGEEAPVGDLACEVVLPNGIIIRCFR